jgi:hypothetical protein
MAYRVDGLGDGVEYARWLLAGADRHQATFVGPAGERLGLLAGRLYEVRPGLLHYVKD